MMAVTYFAGVTSKAGFWIAAPSGVICLPFECVTSVAARCSIGIGVAVGRVDVDGGERSGDVERDAVLLGEDGDRVGADLVGDVAVGGDAVGADDDGLDLALAHQRAGHVVAEDGGGDVVVQQLPRGEAGALQVGAGLVGVDVDLVAALDGGADDAERGAVAAGGEGTGVAVGQDGAFLRAAGLRRALPWTCRRRCPRRTSAGLPR